MRRTLLLIVLLLTPILSGCGGGSGDTSVFADRTDAVFSPEGSVPHGAKAYSPDGLHYACETEPWDTGRIGIFRRSDNELLRTISALPAGNVNDLKGLAWSPDSGNLAVMYHGGLRPGISLYSAASAGLLRTIPDSASQYHFMVFSGDGAWIHASLLGEVIDGSFLTGLPVTKQSFAASSGANLPWINYGWDVGRNPWGGEHGGFSSNTDRLESDFAFLKEHGVSLVRVFVFCDLRSAVLFDESGNPTGFDSFALADLDALVNAARSAGLSLIPVLFDYGLANGVSEEGGAPIGEHPDLITDAAKREALCDLLSQVFRRFRGSSAIRAWEVMNEPEYASAVPSADLEQFVRDVVSAVRAEDPEAKVTVGCRNRGDVARWGGFGLDFYQFHYYDSMSGTFPLDYPVAQLDMDKPVLIGELQPTEVPAKMDTAYGNGYMGALFWSLNADYDFRGVADEYDAWVSGD